MADLATAASGLVHSESGYGHHYVGSAQALIAAGLITEAQLPGRPGGNKVSCTFYDGQPARHGARYKRDERYLSVRRGGGGNFEVVIGHSKSERDARRAAQDADRQAAEEARIAADRRQVASEATPEDYRAFCLRHMDADFALGDCDGLYPFRLPADAAAKIQALFSQARAIVQASAVLPAVRPRRRGHLAVAWSAPAGRRRKPAPASARSRHLRLAWAAS